MSLEQIAYNKSMNFRRITCLAICFLALIFAYTGTALADSSSSPTSIDPNIYKTSDSSVSNSAASDSTAPVTTIVVTGAVESCFTDRYVSRPAYGRILRLNDLMYSNGRRI